MDLFSDTYMLMGPQCFFYVYIDISDEVFITGGIANLWFGMWGLLYIY